MEEILLSFVFKKFEMIRDRSLIMSQEGAGSCGGGATTLKNAPFWGDLINCSLVRNVKGSNVLTQQRQSNRNPGPYQP